MITDLTLTPAQNFARILQEAVRTGRDLGELLDLETAALEAEETED
jgi:hypothetical protein